MRYLAASSLVLLLSSAIYAWWSFEPALLLIPAASLISARFLGREFRHALAGLFILHLFCSAALLYLSKFAYQTWGVLAFAYLFSMAAISYLDLEAREPQKVNA